MPAKEKTVASSNASNKVWVATRDSVAGFGVTPDEAIMAGSEKNFFGASKAGLTLVGSSLHFLMRTETIRESGMWMWLPAELRMIPSTMVTPIPQNFVMTPIPAMMAVVAGELPSFLAFGTAVLAGG